MCVGSFFWLVVVFRQSIVWLSPICISVLGFRFVCLSATDAIRWILCYLSFKCFILRPLQKKMFIIFGFPCPIFCFSRSFSFLLFHSVYVFYGPCMSAQTFFNRFAHTQIFTSIPLQNKKNRNRKTKTKRWRSFMLDELATFLNRNYKQIFSWLSHLGAKYRVCTLLFRLFGLISVAICLFWCDLLPFSRIELNIE